MIALLVAGFFVALFIGLGIAFGGALLAVFLALAGVAVVLWAILAFASGRSPSEVAAQATDRELLGPGGPDDPRRS